MIWYRHRDVEIRPAVPADITVLKENLRQSDIDEIWAAEELKPGKALNDSYNLSSEVYTLLRNGHPIAMFGIIPLPSNPNTGAVWLLGTDEIPEIKKTFVKLTKRTLKNFLTRYRMLYNFVDARREDVVRWLSLCGASFGEPVSYGKAGRPFKPFRIWRVNV